MLELRKQMRALFDERGRYCRHDYKTFWNMSLSLIQFLSVNRLQTSQLQKPNSIKFTLQLDRHLVGHSFDSYIYANSLVETLLFGRGRRFSVLAKVITKVHNGSSATTRTNEPLYIYAVRGTNFFIGHLVTGMFRYFGGSLKTNYNSRYRQ